MKALFVLPYQFVPPDSGNKNLTYGLLKHLAQHLACDIALLVDESKYEPAQIEASIRQAFPAIGQVVVFKKPLGWPLRLARLRAFARGWHPSLGSYFSAELCAWLQDRCSKGCYDLVHFDMFHTAHHRLWVKQVPAVLVASDAYSMASSKARQIASAWQTRLRLRFESWLFSRMESGLYTHFDAVCVVSEVDATYLRSRTHNPHIKRIGIALSGPFLERRVRHFDLMSGLTPPKILITGSIDHDVVAQGVRDFFRQIFPRLKKDFLALEVVVLGKSPEARLLADMNALDGVSHVSFVDDYADFLDQDWIYVYPQRCGSGLQTKVQQAMALGLPVVGYDEAFGGLPVSNGKQAFVCQRSEQMQAAIRQLLESDALRKEIGGAASDHIRHCFSIEKVGEEMLEIYQGVMARSGV